MIECPSWVQVIYYVDLEDAKAQEIPMNLAMTIFSMIAGWMAVAIAMLWGVLRITRRHLPSEGDGTSEPSQAKVMKMLHANA